MIPATAYISGTAVVNDCVDCTQKTFALTYNVVIRLGQKSSVDP
jgi:hypothetical protein